MGHHTYATLTNVNNIATKARPPNVALANILFGLATSLNTCMRKSQTGLHIYDCYE